MPIYEYVCQQCGKKNSYLVFLTESFSPTCNHCGSHDLRRIMSRFAAVRSEESRLESLADPSKWGDLDENDPKSMVRFMKKMGRELGDEMGEDYNQLIEEAEAEADASDSSANTNEDAVE
ncbi:MAG: zinc ribbon domain-containing protein [candidate division KSB1 bacterium]|nr:zinc ribbon domain-containing protein [candidate division KSB1 bacterium]